MSGDPLSLEERAGAVEAIDQILRTLAVVRYSLVEQSMTDERDVYLALQRGVQIWRQALNEQAAWASEGATL